MMTGTDSVFLRHEPCPKCHSRDNLARYSDGHAFCFGCGYKESGSKQSFKTRVVSIKKENQLKYPVDAQNEIDVKGLVWLAKFGITLEEVKKNGIQWSPFRKFLLFPYYKDGLLQAWQGRNFSENDKPKWFSRGNLSELYYTLGSGDTIVLVEDIVSAIKIARFQIAMPLFGSAVPTAKLYQASKHASNLIIWLDADKKKEGMRIARLARIFDFASVREVSTPEDPKELPGDVVRALVS